jgi:hypothetical protein
MNVRPPPLQLATVIQVLRKSRLLMVASSVYGDEVSLRRILCGPVARGSQSAFAFSTGSSRSDDRPFRFSQDLGIARHRCRRILHHRGPRTKTWRDTVLRGRRHHSSVSGEMPVWYGEIEIEVTDGRDKHDFKTIVGVVSQEWSEMILGHVGFLERFDATFSHADRTVTLRGR